MRCASCGTENRPERKFCSQCGTLLALACTACGASNDPGDRFCGECGAALEAPPVAAAQAVTAEAPGAERRLVSVLFADLVGFTSLSDERDAEDVRELLTSYFETARRVIERYGGTIEKFIGDAVMAVWGAPVAQEDDAERAVRAALELVSSVRTLGEEVAASGLSARAGVMTGEAAVTLGAEGQGMVAGDLVNSASRAQSVAEADAVLVDDPTRRTTEAAIVYEDAGEHAFKGRTTPTRLYRALRVVAFRRGEGRSSQLEPPFVGRTREMHLVKEMFHACAEERKAHLVSVVGIAGIGKTRLSSEFERYIDGLIDDVRWHRGRCLAYGEGVTYWALAEMIRMRAGILEEEDPAQASEKLSKMLAEILVDEEDRRWVEPRVAHLLGLETRSAPSREDLFAAWRLFFECMAQQDPTALVFEDLQWADPGLLEFIEYMLDWSRDYPLFVLTLARPEFFDRRPDWGKGKRSFTSIYLEPLSAAAMDELLRGFLPGVPEEGLRRIRERAEGVPLYAVETVRMMLDRSVLVQQGGRFELVGGIDQLDVPETLHALIAARLDALPVAERRLLQDASILGKTFGRAAITALATATEDEIDDLLSALVRKEFLSLQADPRSPERGQYGFVQDLVRRVAYETLSLKERKSRHLAFASYLEQSWGAEDEEIVEVLASHYLDAHQCAPEAEDAPMIKAKARDALAAAGRRAESLAATEQAHGYFRQAADLAEDEVSRAELLAKAAHTAAAAVRSETAVEMFEEAIRLFEARDLSHRAARVSSMLGMALWDMGRLDESVERLESALKVLREDEPDEDVAMLAAQVGRFHFFAGTVDKVMEPVEFALEYAEREGLAEVLSEALNTKSLILDIRGRKEEALALMQRALEIALENDLPYASGRGFYNLASYLEARGRLEDALRLWGQGLESARRLGLRTGEWFWLTTRSLHFLMGMWDDIVGDLEQLPLFDDPVSVRTFWGRGLYEYTTIHVERGQAADVRPLIDALSEMAGSAETQERSAYALATAAVRRGEGDHMGAFEEARRVVAFAPTMSWYHEYVTFACVEAFDSALAAGRLEDAAALLQEIESNKPAYLSVLLRAHLPRFRALLAAAQGQEERVDEWFSTAELDHRSLGMIFATATTLVRHAEWLADRDPSRALTLLEEARGTFEQLRATPWLERVAAIEAGAARVSA
jgi:predicted ATPase/class 3 adenylate cyclase